jgi:hypothetical protein
VASGTDVPLDGNDTQAGLALDDPLEFE